MPTKVDFEFTDLSKFSQYVSYDELDLVEQDLERRKLIAEYDDRED